MAAAMMVRRMGCRSGGARNAVPTRDHYYIPSTIGPTYLHPRYSSTLPLSLPHPYTFYGVGYRIKAILNSN